MPINQGDADLPRLFGGPQRPENADPSLHPSLPSRSGWNAERRFGGSHWGAFHGPPRRVSSSSRLPVWIVSRASSPIEDERSIQPPRPDRPTAVASAMARRPRPPRHFWRKFRLSHLHEFCKKHHCGSGGRYRFGPAPSGKSNEPAKSAKPWSRETFGNRIGLFQLDDVSRIRGETVWARCLLSIQPPDARIRGMRPPARGWSQY